MHTQLKYSLAIDLLAALKHDNYSDELKVKFQLMIKIKTKNS